MRSIIAAVLAGPLVLVGALPAAAGQSALVLGSGASVRMTAVDDSTTDRKSYTEKARNEVQEWQQKIHDFGDQATAKGKEAGGAAAAKGKEAGDAAQGQLDEAWAKTKAASHRLQTVGNDGWKGAQDAYEKASRQLAETWRKVHPDDK